MSNARKPKGGLSPAAEKKWLARQSEFTDALLNGKPLKAGKNGWTIGDSIFLGSVLTQIRKADPTPIGEEDFDRPLSEFV